MAAKDVALAGCEAGDPVIREMEEVWDHRVAERRYLLDFIPEGSRGAELGVYTGLFSGLLAAQPKIAEVTFVDAWWRRMGEHYPEAWGVYGGHGQVTTTAAYELACRRIGLSGLPGRHVEVAFAQDWLTTVPNRSLDWAYCDCTLDPEEEYEILVLLDAKLRTGDARIIGDDWNADGVFIAVNDFVKSHDWDVVFADGVAPYQYMLRRSYIVRSAPLEALYTGNPLRSDVGYDVFRRQWEKDHPSGNTPAVS